VVISAISGTAGVGKTALAVHWAQRYAGRFPDGQLFVNLRGFGPAGAAVTPEAALRQFFDGLGVAAERIPADRDAQAALYRSLLAGKRMLIVVDNAREADQVRPLIPGGPGCLVLVTSRNQLTGLAAGHGARLLPLDVLTDAEAGELLGNRLGPARAEAEPAAVAELARLCARLPLALSVAAAHAAARPGLSLATLAAELRGARARLDRLGTADAATDVRTVFSWSYRQLSTRAGRLFRMLGVHPGPDIGGPAAASLAAVPAGQAGQALSELTGAHLIAEHVPGRYAFHDLLRAYAAEQARTIDDHAFRRAALHRVLDHYLHAGLAASRLLNPYRDQITLGQSQPQACPEEITTLDQAVDWFLAEWRVLLAAQALAADEGFSGHAWQLFWVVATFLQRNGYLTEMLAAGHTALSAALTAGDLAGQAVVHRHLGHAHTVLGDHAEADRHLKAAVSLHRRLGNEMAEARVHLALASLCNAQDRYREALHHGEQGLRLYRALGYRPGEAIALNEVGWALALDGRYPEALDHCAQAHAMRGELHEDTVGQANSLDSLGYIHSRLGHHAEAISCYRQALELLAGTQTVTLRAEMLAHLGDAHQAAGDAGAARRAWHQALAVLDGLHYPEADRIRARLG
jgi:tetratricopeptide (TPR) repeat protein